MGKPDVERFLVSAETTQKTFTKYPRPRMVCEPRSRENSMEVLKQVKIGLQYDSAILLLSMCTK